MALQSQTVNYAKPADTGRKEHRSHPRLIVFLVCLVISVFMWLFIELMKDYTDDISYNITYTNLPSDLILTNTGNTTLSIGMSAQGFELLAAKYAQKKRTLSIDLSSLRIRQTEEGFTAYLPSALIIQQLGNQIRFKKEITSIKPDTLFFKFSAVYHKRVPVKLNVSYSLSGQYDITDSMSCEPKYITVSSIKSIIDTLTFVKTQKLNLTQLDSSVSAKVALFKGFNARLLKFSSDSVTIKLKVEQVTEASYTVPVTINSDGENVKIYPDKVEIVCRVPLSSYSSIGSSDFSTQVEYLPSLNKEKKLRVNLVKFPEKVRVLKIIPSDVEYIVISK
jgi:hypothetical protein